MAERTPAGGTLASLVTDFLSDGLVVEQVRRPHHRVPGGEFADYGIRIDKGLVAFVEVKRITTKLAQSISGRCRLAPKREGRQIRVLLTGARWQAYHTPTAGLPASTWPSAGAS